MGFRNLLAGWTLNRLHAALILAAFVLVFFGPAVLPVDGNFIAGTDVTRYFFWNEQFTKEQLLSGSLPLWNPHYYSGHPFQANPQTFVFYPATLFFVLLPLPWAFNLDTLLHVYLAGLGVLFLVRELTRSTSAGLAAAVVYAFCGYSCEQIGLGHLTILHTAAWIPWIFCFLEKGCRSERIRDFTLAGLVLGLQILGGEPQISLYTVLFLAVYVVARTALVGRDGRHPSLRRLALCLAVVPLVAFGIGAVQILPTAEFAGLSERMANSYEFATQLSFPPRDFFSFLAPSADANLAKRSAYVGILAVVLAVLGAFFSTRKRHASCFVLLLLLAVAMVLGRYTPIYSLLLGAIPGLSFFRVPARCLVMVSFCFSILAGLGYHRLVEEKLSRAPYLAALAGVVGLTASLFAGARMLGAPLASREVLTALGLCVAAAAVVVLSRFTKKTGVIGGALVALLFIDLFVVYAARTPRVDVDRLRAKSAYEEFFDRDPGFHRVATPADGFLGVGFTRFNVNAYSPLAIDRYFRFVHRMAHVPVPKRSRHMLDIRVFEPIRALSSRILGIKYAITKGPDGYRMMRAPWVMPRAQLVRDAIVEPSAEAQLEILASSDFDPQSMVLLESALRGDERTHGSVDSRSTEPSGNDVTIRTYSAHRIELSAASGSDTYLVLSELFYPGWRAYVDGEKVPIVRADHILRAIPLSAGDHEIVFVYRPLSFLAGAVLSLAALVAVLLILRRRSRPATVGGNGAHDINDD